MFICSLAKLGNVQGVKVAGAALAQATFFFGQPAIFNQLADQSNNGTTPGAELTRNSRNAWVCDPLITGIISQAKHDQ